MSYFLLKHENIDVAFFETQGSNVSRLAINEKNKLYIPIGVFTIEHLKKWIEDRGVPVTRQRLSTDLKLSGVSSPFELMIRNYGLSLTDHYWICPKDSEFTWETINLYRNNFKSAYSLDLRDDKRTIAGKTNFVPSASLKGDLKKKWIIDQYGTRRLVKGNYNNTCRQSLCEVLATEIHKRQSNCMYTPYSLINISSDNQQIIGCECPNFTSISTEFISAIDIISNLKKPNELSYYEFYIQTCFKGGVDLRAFMEYQIMTDFIISNSDRHLNNFGILRDSNTLRWLRPAPIFDSGNSMFYNSSYIPTDRALLKLKVTSFLKEEVRLLRYITNRGLVDIRLLPDDNFVFNLLRKDIVKEEINERIVKAYNKKIKYFEDFQNGASIWDYNYR